jgi:hypothetical protein
MFLNIISPFIFASYFVPYFTYDRFFIVSKSYFKSAKVSIKLRYVLPKKNKGDRNWSINVWIIMISPMDIIPFFTPAAPMIKFSMIPVAKMARWTLLRTPRLSWVFLAVV